LLAKPCFSKQSKQRVFDLLPAMNGKDSLRGGLCISSSLALHRVCTGLGVSTQLNPTCPQGGEVGYSLAGACLALPYPPSIDKSERDFIKLTIHQPLPLPLIHPRSEERGFLSDAL